MFDNARSQAHDYLNFLSTSPSPYHAARQIQLRLTAEGFIFQAEDLPWPTDPGRYFIIRDGAVIAWQVPEHISAKNFSFRIVGSHTDSPAFKLKPTPASTKTVDGWNQLEVEIYGGMLTNSWLDRDLGLAGRVVTADGQVHLVKSPAIARIPQLAIHLDQDIDRDGLRLHRQNHLHPIWGFGKNDSAYDYLASLLPKTAANRHVISTDVFLYDAAGPALLGSEQEFVAGARQDNLSSIHASLSAFDQAGEQTISILAAFDHEEIGSSTRAGAAGPILEDVLVRCAQALGANQEEYRAALARSFCVSADAGHWVHPNYADRHDPSYHPVPGAGPLLKINANQRYATEALGSTKWHQWCHKAQVEYQNFVSNNASPCGSTIGPITATRLGIPTLDVGVGLLSMHSARELSHTADNFALAKVLGVFWGE